MSTDYSRLKDQDLDLILEAWQTRLEQSTDLFVAAVEQRTKALHQVQSIAHEKARRKGTSHEPSEGKPC